MGVIDVRQCRRSNEIPMNPTKFLSIGLLIGIGAVALVFSQDSDAIKRGEYLVQVAGGCTCHNNPANDTFSLAGGRPIATPFGTIYGTNITPDRGDRDWRVERRRLHQSDARRREPRRRSLLPRFSLHVLHEDDR